jgi:hypothetical protein
MGCYFQQPVPHGLRSTLPMKTNPHILRRVAACIFLFLSSHAPAAITDDRLAALRENVLKRIDQFKTREMADPPQPSVRDLPDVALALLALGSDPKTAESYLRFAMSCQNMDPASPGYGKVMWRVGHPELHDENAIEFTMYAFAPAVLRYGGKLSDQFRKDMIPHLQAGIAAIRRHRVKVDYTNIYLMKLANLMMLGQIVNDPSAIAEGKANLDNWLAFTRTHGITEYDSPTYGGIQLICLEDVYLQAPDAETKAKARMALDYLWSDFAANYFPGRGQLGGPHSRSYDFLYQSGILQRWFYSEGLAPVFAGNDDSTFSGDWPNAILPGDYHPSEAILDLAHIPQRIVQQRYGLNPGEDRYNYITPDFDIGSASAFRGPQDFKIGAEFASGKKLPVVSVVADPFDAPFGMLKVADADGHHKPRHLRELIAAVQDKGAILALQDISHDLPQTSSTSIATDIVFPAKATAIYLNGKQINNNAPFDLPADSKSTVCIREGNAALAIRIFAADGYAGKPAQYAVKYDGNKWGAGRLVAYHYKGPPIELNCPALRSGVFLDMEHCASDEDFSQFMTREQAVNIVETSSPSGWSASADLGGTRLSAGLDLVAKKIAFRKINDRDIQPLTFTVNGRNLSDEILGRPVPAESAN